MRRTPVVLPEQTESAARNVVDAAVKVHSILGPGLLESVYGKCLCIELEKRGIRCKQQVSLPMVYDGISIEPGLRLDLIVDERVVVELKSAEKLLPVHEAQLLTYLKLSGVRLAACRT